MSAPRSGPAITQAQLPVALSRNGNFLLLGLAVLINQAGAQFAFVATAYWLRTASNSVSLIGLLAMAAALPMLLLGPWGGVVADRHDRRRILIVGDLVCAALCVGLTLLTGGYGIAATLAIGGVYGCTLLLACSVAFTNPALNALVPDLVGVKQLERAIGFNQALGLLAIVLGQALGAGLLTYHSPVLLFKIVAFAYLLSAMLESRLRLAWHGELNGPHVLKRRLATDVYDAWHYLNGRRGMRVLLIAALPVSLFTEPLLVFLSFYTTQALGRPLSVYAYLLSLFSLGLLLGFVFGSLVSLRGVNRFRGIIAAMLGNALCAALLALGVGLVAAAMLLLCIGMLSGTITLHSVHALLAQTEAGMRGRVMAALLTITQGLTPMAMLAFGALGDWLHGDVRPIYGLCALGLLLTGCLCLLSRSLRDFIAGSARSTESGS